MFIKFKFYYAEKLSKVRGETCMHLNSDSEASQHLVMKCGIFPLGNLQFAELSMAGICTRDLRHYTSELYRRRFKTVINYPFLRSIHQMMNSTSQLQMLHVWQQKYTRNISTQHYVTC